MAFLDNPTIILAHIRQSHVTSDDTGMCEMVLIDHDVDLEKTHPPSVPGDSGSEVEGSSAETQGYVYAQSVDITSSWDFGIRRRSNTAQRLERLRKERQNQIKCKNVQWKERNSKQSAQELKSLFEKKSLKEKPPSSGKQSILSVRLEQCPLQLNNPFNEYSKFDGKGHVGTTATKKIDVYLPLHSSQDRLLPMTVVTMASARVQDLIGLICWQYTSEGREPKLNDNVSAYCLHIAEDDGEVDTDFPPLDSNEPIHKFGFSTLALVEKYSSPGLTSKESLFVRINAAHGFSLIQVDNTKVTMKEILLKAVKRRKGSQKISEMLRRSKCLFRMKELWHICEMPTYPLSLTHLSSDMKRDLSTAWRSRVSLTSQWTWRARWRARTPGSSAWSERTVQGQTEFLRRIRKLTSLQYRICLAATITSHSKSA
ncbi:target of rapamycin complex 2 subunit MAPKAP1 isoform X3 [Peromyscus eremicus]|uniref:target of rapamycin complex 2 subunit MAPKAP1 isoform X3 n=1 Tax=Peromyscus eremicus TaxID=42410 RepID=UPI0027DB57E1|nr:target of rapamycin complex 2 subunit MAPKAP1 isoform X3 [Peromyscus eremicus]